MPLATSLDELTKRTLALMFRKKNPQKRNPMQSGEGWNRSKRPRIQANEDSDPSSGKAKQR